MEPAACGTRTLARATARAIARAPAFAASLAALAATLAGSACDGGGSPPGTHGSARATLAEAAVEQPMALAADQADLLGSWYRKVGPRREGERFGDLIVRAGRVQLGMSYVDRPQAAGPEVLQIDLSSFQCVSFVETTVAVARCVWMGRADEACFLAEVESARYRAGNRTDYASRLHYFPDWIGDNVQRGRLWSVTGALGGHAISQPFTFMTDHPRRYPALAAPDQLAKIAEAEARLSSTDFVVLDRLGVDRAQWKLESGDLVALVSNKRPGMLIAHAGFVDRRGSRLPRLLHASSSHRRVLLTATDIASYLRRRPHRQGLMVARFLPPPP